MRKICLFIAFAILGSCCHGLSAQPSTSLDYYRYFTVKLKKISPEDFQLLKSYHTEESVFTFEGLCDSNSKILATVDASYPKRIEDLKIELNQWIETKLPKAKIEAIETIGVSEKNNYCQ